MNNLNSLVPDKKEKVIVGQVSFSDKFVDFLGSLRVKILLFCHFLQIGCMSMLLISQVALLNIALSGV